MATVIKKELGIHTDLVKGGLSSFEVFYKGRLIFSKVKEGRFPKNKEVIAALRLIK